MLANLLRKKQTYDRKAAEQIYLAVTEQARMPHFYSVWDVPDTVEGRYEMLILHMFFVLRLLQEDKDKSSAQTKEAEDFAQALFDIMFKDMDRSLREQGVGDLGVPKRIKKMAKAFYGRVFAYENGLKDGTLAAAVGRNIYDSNSAAPEKSVKQLAQYAEKQYAHIMAEPAKDILAGRIDWLPVK